MGTAIPSGWPGAAIVLAGWTKRSRDRLSAKLIYEGPLQPPVAAGSKVGILRILEGDLPILDIPLYAAAAMGEGGLRRRAEDALAELAGDAVRRLLRRLPQ